MCFRIFIHDDIHEYARNMTPKAGKTTKKNNTSISILFINAKCLTGMGKKIVCAASLLYIYFFSFHAIESFLFSYLFISAYRLFCSAIIRERADEKKITISCIRLLRVFFVVVVASIGLWSVWKLFEASTRKKIGTHTTRGREAGGRE